MAATDKIYDHPASKKARGEQTAKKGDRENDPQYGEIESTGDQPTDDMVKGTVREQAPKDGGPKIKHYEFWKRIRKKDPEDEKAVPTS